MKKPTDFAKHVTDFLANYLPKEFGARPNTISSYRDSILLLLVFLRDVKEMDANHVTLKSITRKTVLEYLEWVQKERSCIDSTRNIRLAAIHSFCTFLEYKSIENLSEIQKIQSIPFKKTKKRPVDYLTIEGLKLLLEQPDLNTGQGRRHAALIGLMYDSGARVQELINVKHSSLTFGAQPHVRLLGKGNKERLVPLLNSQIHLLSSYIREFGLDNPDFNSSPLFFRGKRRDYLTRAGVNYILKKYAEMARKKNRLLIPEKISCHSLRHSKAMHLLQANVDLIKIRDFLGHSTIETTELYARQNWAQMIEALSKAHVNINPIEAPKWKEERGLLEELKRYGVK